MADTTAPDVVLEFLESAGLAEQYRGKKVKVVFDGAEGTVTVPDEAPPAAT